MIRATRTELPQRDYLVGCGSNFEAERWLGWALAELRARFAPVQVSTPAWSRAEPPRPGLPQVYLNAAARVRCDWPAWRFARLLQALERASGRSAALKAAGLVPLDLDLLGRDCGGQLKRYPRRAGDWQAGWLQPHLAELGLDQACSRGDLQSL